MIIHVYNYNVHSEKRYFLGEHRSLYDLIMINGNIVSHTPAGVAAYLATANKPFYIDPQTHIFQHATVHLKSDNSDSSKGEMPNYQFKPSIIKLAKDRLGEPFSRVIDGDRPLSPSDFTRNGEREADAIITAACESVIRFQKETMVSELDDESRELMDENRNFLPDFIVAPYFYLSPIRFMDWLRLTLECYRKTKQIETSTPVYLSLVISKEAIEDRSEQIAREVGALQPDGIILWIDCQVEEDLSISELRRFMKLVRGLKNGTARIINSHGGYFSTLLCHPQLENLLDGAGHCINYGESRSVVPVGGGIPMARFYFPVLHSRIRFGDALGIARAKNWLDSPGSYRDNVCSCRQCTELLDKSQSANAAFFEYGRSSPVTFSRRSGSIVSLEYPTKEAKQAAARHYLYNKAKEFNDVREKALRELISDLENAFREISPYSGDDIAAHLNNWAKVLRP